MVFSRRVVYVVGDKMKPILHYATYVPYTGVYALCHHDQPEFDCIEEPISSDWKKVTCPDCKKMKGTFQILICECTHKEHGHDDNVGRCSRCHCLAFKEKESK